MRSWPRLRRAAAARSPGTNRPQGSAELNAPRCTTVGGFPALISGPAQDMHRELGGVLGPTAKVEVEVEASMPASQAGLNASSISLDCSSPFARGDPPPSVLGLCGCALVACADSLWRTLPSIRKVAD
jgi:hypothetical protein